MKWLLYASGIVWIAFACDSFSQSFIVLGIGSLMAAIILMADGWRRE